LAALLFPLILLKLKKRDNNGLRLPIVCWFSVREKHCSFTEKVRPINSSTKQSIISGVGFPRRQHPPRPAGWWTPHMDKQVQFYCWKHFVHVTVEFRIWLLHCITHHLLLLCNKAVTVDKFFWRPWYMLAAWGVKTQRNKNEIASVSSTYCLRLKKNYNSRCIFIKMAKVWPNIQVKMLMIITSNKFIIKKIFMTNMLESPVSYL
jgi:hypothetical protein